MKDKLYMVLAFAGIIILSIVFWFNRDTTKGEVAFDIIDSYYIPADQAISNTYSADELYAEMTGSREVQCPAVKPVACSNPLYISGVFSSYEKSKYGTLTYFVDGGAVKLSDDSPAESSDDSSTESSGSYIKIGDINALPSSKKAIKFGEIGISSDVAEIVAPFKFTFLNNNTDMGNSIIIVNSKGNCKIEFNNVTNWFCAGPYGTEMESGNGTYTNNTSWEEHQGKHLTIIGASRNSKVSDGQAGQVIGYGNAETTITVYNKDTAGNWVETNLLDLLTTKEQ